ncbi:hypothetical protein BIW11_06017 [Tropilaelaps mercedesae]|uniref:Uncharacterized protein n=1 Tax=Tropilaelaps mercedesae TaxID=418985 RepID=A0A1V9Y091_9ACAR|nr:hypothetical protein BIW11_06017 [Tropilaelaps mercedesae]
MSSLCEFVNRNVARVRIVEKIENHPKFPPKHRGENLQKYLFGLAMLFHVYMLLAGWLGVWSFFTRCPGLHLYEKVVLVGLRFGIIVLHCVAASFFMLSCLGGSLIPPCERVTQVYHQLMVLYRSFLLPTTILFMLGSLLGMNFDQFILLFLYVPIEALALLWHVVICDAFLRWGNISVDESVNEAIQHNQILHAEEAHRKTPQTSVSPPNTVSVVKTAFLEDVSGKNGPHQNSDLAENTMMRSAVSKSTMKKGPEEVKGQLSNSPGDD